VDAVDAFVRLHDDGYVSLVKYDAGPSPVSYVDMQRDNGAFFYRGSFKVTVTPRGRLDFERKQAAIPRKRRQKRRKASADFTRR